MSIPSHSFRVRRRGRIARLRLRNLPVPDTFFFGNNVSIAGEIDVDIIWRATSEKVTRGKGTSVPPDDFGAFRGEFRDARCIGWAGGRETGFRFKTGRLTEAGFFAQLGRERNGAFL